MNNKSIFFHFENYNSHVFKSIFIFKVMLAFNREILVNLSRIMIMLNGLNYLSLQEYNYGCNEKLFARKIMVI